MSVDFVKPVVRWHFVYKVSLRTLSGVSINQKKEKKSENTSLSNKMVTFLKSVPFHKMHNFSFMKINFIFMKIKNWVYYFFDEKKNIWKCVLFVKKTFLLYFFNVILSCQNLMQNWFFLKDLVKSFMKKKC